MDLNPIGHIDWNAKTPEAGLVAMQRNAKGEVPASEIAKQFEQIFVQQLLRELSKSLDGGFFGDSSGSHVYQGYFETIVADKIAQGRGIGIAPAVEKSLGAQMLAAQPEKLFLPGQPGEESR